jgi:hypothetical protein
MRSLCTGGHESVGTGSQHGHILCFLRERAPYNVTIWQIDTMAAPRASQNIIFNNARCCLLGLGFGLVIRV